MSRSLNKVMLIGHLGATPELKYTGTGKAVVTVNLATNTTHRNEQGEVVEDATWHRLIFWERQAETASEFLRKGSPIYVEGRLNYRQYDDPQSGQKRYITEIIVRDYMMLDSRSSGEQSGESAPQQPSASAGSEEYDPDEEDLPF